MNVTDERGSVLIPLSPPAFQIKHLDAIDLQQSQMCRVKPLHMCQALTVHAQIEEEIFYSTAREALGDEGKDLLDEAKVEHETLKDLIEQIEGSDSDDDLFDAHVKVLGEYVKHHVKEEEGELFPNLRKSEMDLVEVGAQLAARKKELMAQMKAAA